MSKEYDPKRARDLAVSWNGEYFCAIRNNWNFSTVISHVLKKFKMANLGSMLSEIARVYAIQQNKLFPSG